jgi:segregation and condensation protein B
MAADSPVPIERLQSLFSLLDEGAPDDEEIRAALTELQADFAGHGVELVEVAGGWRFQTCAQVATWVNRLWEERKPKYSRALLETLAIIAYRQPITRGEIEDIRGVAVSTGIIKTLHDRDWVKIVGHREVPGRPAIYATTRQFLEYFGLRGLGELPTLAELRDVEAFNSDLFADTGVVEGAEREVEDEDEALDGAAADGSPRVERSAVPETDAVAGAVLEDAEPPTVRDEDAAGEEVLEDISDSSVSQDQQVGRETDEDAAPT